MTKDPTQFSQLHLALTEPKKAGKKEVLKETKLSNDLVDILLEKVEPALWRLFLIPTEKINNSKNDEGKSEAGFDNTNRFRVILNSLKKTIKKIFGSRIR